MVWSYHLAVVACVLFVLSMLSLHLADDLFSNLMLWLSLWTGVVQVGLAVFRVLAGFEIYDRDQGGPLWAHVVVDMCNVAAIVTTALVWRNYDSMNKGLRKEGLFALGWIVVVSHVINLRRALIFMIRVRQKKLLRGRWVLVPRFVEKTVLGVIDDANCKEVEKRKGALVPGLQNLPAKVKESITQV